MLNLINLFKYSFIIFIPLIVEATPLASKKITPITTKTKQYKVNSGDSFSSLLLKAKFNSQNYAYFISGLENYKSFKLKPGVLYEIETSKEHQIITLKVYQFSQNKVLVFETEENRPHLYYIPISYEIKKKTVKGKINGSIIGTIYNKTKDKIIAYRFLDAFTLDHNVKRQVKKNAHFKIVYEEKYLNGRFVKTHRVIEAHLEIDGKLIKRHFFENEKGGSFVDTETNFIARPFYLPLPKMQITSLFQRARKHPVKGRRVAHLGIDLEALSGTPIYTPMLGQVIKFGKNRAAGYYVVLKHSNGYKSYYNHLKSYNKDLYIGQNLDVGKIIGEVGCTGYCTQSHLHFALKKRGRYINPIKLIKPFPYILEPYIKSERQRIAKNQSQLSL